ncbi:MAG: MotA/TolQ/ExbB proton channel family protein [Kiritimatiellae bacterium]|jgi:biopolymer transport protein ExbB/TolQ|nr:MotA/TolQ/ExbB proton channel family protein [Kiritimatiellia bacterium]
MEFILKYWGNAGSLAFVLAIVCFAICYYFFRIYFTLKRASDVPNGFEKQLKTCMRESTFEVFKQKFEDSTALVAKVLCQNIKDNSLNLKIVDYDRMVNSSIKKITVNIIILSALTMAAPLVGLFGTVLGMIETFDGLAGSATDTGSVLASGISKALITTQAGLIISIPGIFGILFLAVAEVKLKAQMASYRTLINLYRDRE